MEGPQIDQLQVLHWQPAIGGAPTTVLPLVRFHTPFLLGRTSNEHGELPRPRLTVRGGVPRIELPNGTRLFVYERMDQSGHGLLSVQASGEARIVHAVETQLDLPLAVGTDCRHVAYVRDEELVVVRIDGGTFANGQTTMTSTVPAGVEPESLVLGPQYACMVVDSELASTSDRLLRCAFGGVPEDVAPPSVLPTSIEPTMAIAGNGSLVAFLREHEFGEHDVWVVGPTGPARQIPLPEREYRSSTWIPLGIGHVHLLLNDDGSRLLVTEIRTEDELFLVDTAIGGAAVHRTGDATFAPYIGSHILPHFQGHRLLVASGHVGWRDWYVLQPDGTVDNLTQTGSSEPPFLLGSLDVRERFALANGHALVTDAVGATLRLRRLDPAGAAQTLFTDLVVAPTAGVAVSGVPDLRVAGTGGQRVVSGQTGGTVLAAPPGIGLTDPVRGANGWRACFAHLPEGLGVLVVQLPDGSLVLGGLGVAPPQIVATANGELAALWPSRWDVWTAAGCQSLPLPASVIRVALSGVGD